MNNFIKDNRGFMMAELIIVSSIIIVTLVALYASFSKMYTTYSERNFYLDVDGKYALKSIYDDLVNNGKFLDLINSGNGLNSSSDDKLRYVNIIDSNGCSDLLSTSLCTILNNNFQVQTVVFGNYDDNIFTNINVDDDNTNTEDNLLSDNSYNSEFKNYFKYLGDYLDFNDNYSYIFLIEYKVGENTYYSNYLVR